jgi:hypothetical protein
MENTAIETETRKNDSKSIRQNHISISCHTFPDEQVRAKKPKTEEDEEELPSVFALFTIDRKLLYPRLPIAASYRIPS